MMLSIDNQNERVKMSNATKTNMATYFILSASPAGEIGHYYQGSYVSKEGAERDAELANNLMGHLGFRYFTVSAEGLQGLRDAGLKIRES